MGWYAMMRDIYCCWSVSLPSLDAWAREKDLLVASTCPSLSMQCYFYRDRLSNFMQNTRFMEYHLCTENGMMCYKVRHPLLLKWFIIFLGCIKRWKELVIASSRPLLFTPCHFTLLWLTLKLHTKYKIWWGSLLCTGKGMIYCKGRRPLLIMWSVSYPFTFHKIDFNSFLKHLLATHGSYHVISPNVVS